MSKTPILLLGPSGATFSERAWKTAVASGLVRLPDLEDSELISVLQNRDVLPGLEKYAHRRIPAYGAIALKTRANGRVRDTYEGIARYGVHHYDMGRPIIVLAALRMNLSFALMAKHGMSVRKVRGVIGHDQATGACERHITKHAWTIKTCESNGLAAEMVATDPNYAQFASIGPAEAAAKYGLTVLNGAFEDAPAATTFLILGPRSALENVTPGTGSSNQALIMFRMADKPGALLHALEPFYKFGFNLRHVHSMDETETVTDFVALTEIPNDRLGDFKKCRSELAAVAEKTKIFGPYPVHLV